MKHLNDTLSSLIAHSDTSGLEKLSSLIERKKARTNNLLDDTHRGVRHVQDLRNLRSLEEEELQIAFAKRILTND